MSVYLTTLSHTFTKACTTLSAWRLSADTPRSAHAHVLDAEQEEGGCTGRASLCVTSWESPEQQAELYTVMRLTQVLGDYRR